jgi:hypothetical protein
MTGLCVRVPLLTKRSKVPSYVSWWADLYGNSLTISLKGVVSTFTKSIPPMPSCGGYGTHSTMNAERLVVFFVRVGVPASSGDIL